MEDRPNDTYCREASCKVCYKVIYRIAGKFGEFGESQTIRQTKLIPTIDNPLADLFIHQTFFRQTLKNSRFAKRSARQTFPLYGIMFIGLQQTYWDAAV